MSKEVELGNGPRRPEDETTRLVREGIINPPRRGGTGTGKPVIRKPSEYDPLENVPSSPIVGDPLRPSDSPVNQKPSMKYEKCLAAAARGELKKPTLTDRGWVMPADIRRRKA